MSPYSSSISQRPFPNMFLSSCQFFWSRFPRRDSTLSRRESIIGRVSTGVFVLYWQGCWRNFGRHFVPISTPRRRGRHQRTVSCRRSSCSGGVSCPATVPLGPISCRHLVVVIALIMTVVAIPVRHFRG